MVFAEGSMRVRRNAAACYSAKRSPIPHFRFVQSFSMVFSVTFCWTRFQAVERGDGHAQLAGECPVV